MISTLKVHTPETRTLIEKIKAEIKKRAEAKARRMLLKVPKRQLKRLTATRSFGQVSPLAPLIEPQAQLYQKRVRF
jgi:hypothetical protein